MKCDGFIYPSVLCPNDAKYHVSDRKTVKHYCEMPHPTLKEASCLLAWINIYFLFSGPDLTISKVT